MTARVLTMLTVSLLLLAGCARDPGVFDLDTVAPPTVGPDYTPAPNQAPTVDPDALESRRAFLQSWCTQLVEDARALDQPVHTLDVGTRGRAVVDAPVPAGHELERQAVEAIVTRLTDATSQSADKRVVATIETELDQHLSALLRPLAPLRGTVDVCVAMDTATLRAVAEPLHRRVYALAATGTDVDDAGWLRTHVPTAAQRDLPAAVQATVTDAALVQLTHLPSGTAVCVDVAADRTATITDGGC